MKKFTFWVPIACAIFNIVISAWWMTGTSGRDHWICFGAAVLWTYLAWEFLKNRTGAK